LKAAYVISDANVIVTYMCHSFVVFKLLRINVRERISPNTSATSRYRRYWTTRRLGVSLEL